MLRVITLPVLTLLALPSQAFQLPVDMRPDVPVKVETGLISSKYRQEGNLLKPLSVYDMMSRYPEAKAEMGAAKPLLYAGMVFSAVGGVMIGYPLGTSLAGGDFNAPVFFTGVGLAAVGITLGKLSDNRLARAVKAYNASLPEGLGLDGHWTPERGHLALRVRF